MRRMWHRAGMVALAGLTGAAFMTACGGDDKQGQSLTSGQRIDTTVTNAGVIGSWVGKVDGSDAFIALVKTETGAALAYICDSNTISQWFRTDDAGRDTLDVTAANGATLDAKLTRDNAEGTVTLADGQTLNFKAPRATADASLFRARNTIDGVEYLGGWIVLANGEQRGRITGGAQPTTATINVSNPTVPVGAGALEARNVLPFVCPFPWD